MAPKHVVVEDYNPIWKDKFVEIKNVLNDAIGDISISIQHVGSTSVEGLAAKPVIDIDVIIENRTILEKVIERLEQIGYVYEGNLGIEDREAFKYHGNLSLMKHHLYVCPKDSKELKRHMSFRDYLRENPKAVEEYGNIKKEGAKLYPYDIDSYIEYKSSVINRIYDELGLN